MIGVSVSCTTRFTRRTKMLPSFDQTLSRLVANLEPFDVAKVWYEDIQRTAIAAATAAE